MKTPPNSIQFSASSLAELGSLLSVDAKQIEWVLSRLNKQYFRQERPKRGGGTRTLWVPRAHLRAIQDAIQKQILAKVSHPECVQGGIRKRSIITNAKHHLRKPVLSTMDIHNCFPNITVQKVQSVFEQLGFSGAALAVLTKLTTWEFQLPQGAPTSPAIANLALANLDRRQLGVAKHHGFEYTRFVDDLASSGGVRLRKVRNLQERIVKSEGFSLKPLKEGQKKLMYREHDRQELTGLVLNEKVNLSREKRQGIIGTAKAALRGKGELSESDRGRLLWLSSVNAAAGSDLVKEIRGQRKGK